MNMIAILTTDEVALVTSQLEANFVDPASICSFLQRSESFEVRKLLDHIRTDKKRNAIDDVREHGHASGILGDLFIEMAKQHPRRTSLQTVAWHFVAKYQMADATVLSKLKGLDGEECSFNTLSLEGLTSYDPFLNVSALESWCADVKKRVCQIRCGTNEKGTGFLIGSDLILTCYHVVETHISADLCSDISVRFDFFESETGDAPTNIEWEPVDPNWKIPHAPYNQGEELGAHPTPNKGELDFAILKLNEPLEGRGHYQLSPNYELPPRGTPIMIVGHPGPESPLQPLRFSMAAPGLEGTNSNDTRLVYKTSTERGSSGSPVFDRHLRLIGMHHNSGQLSKVNSHEYMNNRGIPISSICWMIEDMAKERPELNAIVNVSKKN